jgi:hypothetical protein
MERATVVDAATAQETLTRWGRGASYHEFEVVFGDLRRHVVASGYDPILLPERVTGAEELALARQIERVRPDLAPSFSRYWIDVLLSPEPIDQTQVSFIWPWTMEVPAGSRVAWTRWDAVELLAETPMVVTLPCPTTRVVLAVAVPGEDPTVAIQADGAEQLVALTGPPGADRHADIDLAAPVTELELRLDRSGYLTFLGYEAPADRGLA